jgi:hypothetical protein
MNSAQLERDRLQAILRSSEFNLQDTTTVTEKVSKNQYEHAEF